MCCRPAGDGPQRESSSPGLAVVLGAPGAALRPGVTPRQGLVATPHHSISNASPEVIQDICSRNLIVLGKINGQGPVGVILCFSGARGRHFERAAALPWNHVRSHSLRILVTENKSNLGVSRAKQSVQE